jgi:ParB/RepB/Spo0J family partition protein
MSKAPAPKQIVVDVDQVDEDPENARLTFDQADLKILGESLKDRQLYAIQVRKLNNGRYQLVDGARRLRAAKLAGIKQLRADDLGGHIDAKTAAILAATANLEREDLTPLEEARAFDRLLKAGLQKKQITDRFGVPFNTLQSRLELLELPEAVAKRIGDARGGAVFGLGHAKAIVPIAKQPKLLEAALKAFDNAQEYPEAREAAAFVTDALVKAKVAVRPREDITRSWEIDNIEQRATKEFDFVELPSRYGNGKERLVLDVAGFTKKAEEWRKAAQAERAAMERRQSRSSGGHGGAMSAAALQADRVKRETRKLQVALLAKHLKGSKRFGDELQRRIYQDYLDRLGQVATSQFDQEAVKELMGENVLNNGSPSGDIVNKLWKTDRAKLDRFLCAMLYMANKEYTTKIVKKDDVARMATGHTWQHVEGLAKQAVKAKHEGKATANLKSGSKAHEEKPKKGRDAKGKPAPSKKAAPAPTKAPTWAELQAYAKKHPGVAPGSAATRKAVEQLTAAQRQALVHDQATKTAKKPAKGSKAAKAAKKPVVETAAVKAARATLAGKAVSSVVAKMNPAKAAKGAQAQLPVTPAAVAAEVLEKPLAGLQAVRAAADQVLDHVELQPKAPSATTVRLQALAAANKGSSAPAAPENPGV